jgi:hypothetical protein
VQFKWRFSPQFLHLTGGWFRLMTFVQEQQHSGPGFLSTSPALSKSMRRSQAGWWPPLVEKTFSDDSVEFECLMLKLMWGLSS